MEQMPSGEEFHGQMRQRLSCLATMTQGMETVLQPVVLGAFHRVNVIMNENHYLQILQLHLKSTFSWLTTQLSVPTGQ